jgi:hypothetical protein
MLLHIVRYYYPRALILSAFLLVSVRAAAPDIKVTYIKVPELLNPFDRLIYAVVQVESNGDTMAFNLCEEAIGAFQIRPVRLLDYNQRTGTNFKAEDCYNFKISKEIFLFYARITGHYDFESIARNWNGRGKKTLDYWEKVKTYL